MRGSPSLCEETYRKTGIIPAHAGLTNARRTTTRPGRDHPRACGAHHVFFELPQSFRGSSPRMRGSRARVIAPSGPTGIIPAHAGLTFITCKPLCHKGDHPRACGAHCISQEIGVWPMGSSPRMRGSQCIHQENLLLAGIIPAHAGLTSVKAQSADESGDHPRACGAHRT